MTDYHTGEMKRIRLAESFIKKNELGMKTNLATTYLPEVVTLDDIDKILQGFSQAFYIDKNASMSYGSVSHKNFAFKTITAEHENMALGVKWLKAITVSGKNIINEDKITSDDDLTLTYVNNTNGISDSESVKSSSVYINTPDDTEEKLAYAEGEATISFYPGYTKVALPSQSSADVITCGKIKFSVEAIGKHYVKIILQGDYYVDEDGPELVAYNKEGFRLSTHDKILYPLYGDNKSAKDFTIETLPDDVDNMAYFVLFDGEIDTAELYFKTKRVTEKVKVRTTEMLHYSMEWDDYKNVTPWVNLPFEAPKPFVALSPEALAKQTFFKFKRTTALFTFNASEINLLLPKTPNSTFAKYNCNDFKYQINPDSEYRALRYYENGDDIEGFKDKETYSDIELTPNESRIAGEVAITYPTNVAWFSATNNANTLYGEHKVLIEGGLVTYYPPKDYVLPEFGKCPAYFIRALSATGELLHLHSSTYLVDYEKGILFGFWGEVATVEIAIVMEWTKCSTHFDLMVPPLLKASKVFSDLAGFLIASSGITDDDGNEIELSKLKKEEVLTPVLSIDYNIAMVTNAGAKPTNYRWSGFLLGTDTYSEAHLTRLIEEATTLLKDSKKETYYKSRVMLPTLFFDVLNKDNTIVESITLAQLINIAKAYSALTDKLATLIDIHDKWSEQESFEGEDLTGFSKEKYSLACLIEDYLSDKNIGIYEKEVSDNKQITYLYDSYSPYFQEDDKDDTEKRGEAVAYLFGRNKKHSITSEYLTRDYPNTPSEPYYLHQKMTDELNDIDKRIIQLYIDQGVEFYLNDRFLSEFNEAIEAKKSKNIMHAYAKKLRKHITDAQFFDFVFKLSVLQYPVWSTSAHRYLHTQDFKVAYTNVSDKYKDRCYLFFVENDPSILKDHLALVLPRIKNGCKDTVIGATVRALLGLNKLGEKNYDKELLDLIKSVKSPFIMLWCCDYLLKDNEEHYRKFTFDLTLECINNYDSEIDLTDESNERLAGHYKGEAAVIFDAIASINHQVANEKNEQT